MFPTKLCNYSGKTIRNHQKLSLNHNNIEIRKYNAETQPFIFTNIQENKNTSLEVSPIENMDTLIHSQPSENRMSETNETDFNSTLLDDGTLFSSHTVNTLIDLEDSDQKDNQNNNNNNTTNNSTTTDNAHICQNHQHRQPVNSTELTQKSDPLKTTIPILSNVNTTLTRLHRQKSVHFNTEPIIPNYSTQPTHWTNQNIQITPQQLVNIVRQLISQNTQQNTNASTPYYLQAASTQTPSPVVRRNTQMMYPYVGGSVPMQQSLRP